MAIASSLFCSSESALGQKHASATQFSRFAVSSRADILEAMCGSNNRSDTRDRSFKRGVLEKTSTICV
jgi:hypothetical protein